MPPLRKPRPQADRSGSPAESFSDTFARRPATPRRGLVPGLRVWGTVGGAAALTAVAVLAVPLLGRVDLFPDRAPTSAAAVAAAGQPSVKGDASGPASPAVTASRRPAGQPARNAPGGSGGSGGGVAGAGGGVPGSQTGGGQSVGGGVGGVGGVGGAGGGAGGSGSGSGTKSGGTKPNSPSKPSTSKPSSGGSGGSAVSIPGSLLIGSASHRCVDVIGGGDGVGRDGAKLDIWDCSGRANQKWEFKSDGTVRSLGLCMDLAWGNTGNGTAIQIAKCSGSRAQLFYLSSAGDLVSSQADKCVDVKDNGTGNGTRLQLWTCGGTANQKWRKG
ncbi:ricin-type beta-trefoil lectin domain protein [Streptomyces sp. NPDC086787]|uniref:ricin-type beta-trefoil lectin domain protein n=1 Tax=Streptomyces sp. NPDC086787 TaxID=3365759 RepID=UPI00380C52DC